MTNVDTSFISQHLWDTGPWNQIINHPSLMPHSRGSLEFHCQIHHVKSWDNTETSVKTAWFYLQQFCHNTLVSRWQTETERLWQELNVALLHMAQTLHLTIFGSVRIHTRRGIKNAAVLPLPVSATPMTSRFNRPIGIACRWIGDGSFMNKHDNKNNCK